MNHAYLFLYKMQTCTDISNIYYKIFRMFFFHLRGGLSTKLLYKWLISLENGEFLNCVEYCGIIFRWTSDGSGFGRYWFAWSMISSFWWKYCWSIVFCFMRCVMTPYGNRKPRGDVKTVQRMQFHRAMRDREEERKRGRWKMECRVSEKWREGERGRLERALGYWMSSNHKISTLQYEGYRGSNLTVTRTRRRVPRARVCRYCKGSSGL